MEDETAYNKRAHEVRLIREGMTAGETRKGAKRPIPDGTSEQLRER